MCAEATNTVAASFWLTENDGLVLGVDPKNNLVKTTDGGTSWETLSSVGLAGGVKVMYFADTVTGWLGGKTNRGFVLKTADGGKTWREQNIPADFGAVEVIHFFDAKHGWVASDNAVLYTNDGGATWREITTTPQMPYDLLAFADKDHGVVGDEEAEHLYRTDDGCKTFVDISAGVQLSADNVIGERRGSEAPDEIVIIGGHFDSYSDEAPRVCPGAEDNASGTACAMAAARAFRNMSFKRTVRYVAFGDEESGLNGSRAYAEYCAEKGEKIVAVLNADMVCYDEDAGARDDFVAGGGRNGRWMYAYLAAVGGLYGQKIIYEDRGGNVSDGRSFENVGYPALGVTEGGKGSGGAIEYPYYHSSEDTLDKLHPALGVRFVRDYAAMLAHLAGVGDYLFEPEPPGYAAAPRVRPFAVYPNPYCYATSAGGVNFVGIKSPATVEIYDLAGRRVAREEVTAGRDECVWRPATPEGETLAPGVYLYRVDGQEQKKAGKIVVAR